MASKKNLVLYCLLFFALACLTAGGLCLLTRYSSGGKIPGERYYRAVHVLQKIDANARTVEESIPVRVTYHDDTEALLHHPDKILILHHLADELAAMRRERPKARFYEACARLALGERKKAVTLLSGYVIENDYKASHYDMLCEALYELEDYRSLLLICLEWQERDPACQENRLRFTWAAQFNLGRYAAARRVMQGEGPCLGWRAAVFDAKTALAENGEAEAKLLLEQALARFPDYQMQIMRLWNILKPLGKV